MTNQEVKKALAQKIKATLKEQGIRKGEFAIMMDVSPSTITKWLSGDHNFTIRTIFQIELRLKITLIKVTNPDHE